MMIDWARLSEFIVLPALGFLISALICLLMAGGRIRWLPLDHPNHRSLHDVPVPRAGGIGILLGIFVVALLMDVQGQLDYLFKLVLLAMLPVVLVGGADDWSGVRPGWRFLIQTAAAVLLLLGGLTLERLSLPGMSFSVPAVVAGALTLLTTIWVTNLYNFMDGMDGFAAGMTVIGFGTLAILGGWAGDMHYALFCAVISATAAGFLLYNFPPARIFMGDLGSGSLGFLAASCVLVADRRGLFPWWAGLVVFSPFVVDATWTLVARFLRREAVWQAHRTHFYQRLVGAGWSHRRVVLCEYSLMICCSLLIFLILKAAPSEQWLGIGALVAVYAGLGWGINALMKDRVVE